MSEYDNLSEAAYLRAKEDYLMGINFSRLLTLKYGNSISNYMGTKYTVISVGRVMTCVLGMIVRREREIREFVKTPFYRVTSGMQIDNYNFEGEWKAVNGSKYFETPLLYKENGFKAKETAEQLITALGQVKPLELTVTSITKKDEKKNPPLLYNLAELQNDCLQNKSDETLKIVQESRKEACYISKNRYARVLSTAVAKEIHKNIDGMRNYAPTVTCKYISKGQLPGIENKICK